LDEYDTRAHQKTGKEVSIIIGNDFEKIKKNITVSQGNERGYNLDESIY
jgi:hypothetical protein